MNQSVIVVGGGLAGLVAGYRLQQAGHDVSGAGGRKVGGGGPKALTQDGFGLERGPHSYRGQSPTLHALASRTGDPALHSRRRWYSMDWTRWGAISVATIASRD